MPREEQESIAMVSRVRACVSVHLCLQCLLRLETPSLCGEEERDATQS